MIERMREIRALGPRGRWRVRARRGWRAHRDGIAVHARVRDGCFSVLSRTRAIAVVHASRGR